MTTQNLTTRVEGHLTAMQNHYSQDWFVVCLQGSQNYGMDDAESDVDSKALLIPSFSEVALNKKPVSHTLVMENEEHCDVKDVREYFKIFRKSNINFVEILFTDYWIVNHKYTDLWLELRANAEALARYNPYAAVKCMKGMAAEKLHALDHEYPSRIHMIEKYGYDPKQLSHLIRIDYFIQEFVKGTPYKDCICPKDKERREELLRIKRTGLNLTKHCAMHLGEDVFNHIKMIADDFTEKNPNNPNKEMDELLNSVLFRLLQRSYQEEWSK